MNPQAVQIGLTATPRQLTTTEDTAEAKADEAITADNLAYFGEPVYEYEIAQAMEDGYLAACDFKLALIDLDARGLTAAEVIQRNPTDANTGRPLTRTQIAPRYDAANFEKQVILPDRVKAMCRDLFEQMLANVIHRDPDGTPLGPSRRPSSSARRPARRPRCRRDEQSPFRLVRGQRSGALRPLRLQMHLPLSAATTSSPTFAAPFVPISWPLPSSC